MIRAGVRLSDHARQRCREMRLDLQDVVRVLHDPAVTTRPSRGTAGNADARLATSDVLPDVAVVYYPSDGVRPHLIVTVVWRTYETYVREGATYRRAER